MLIYCSGCRHQIHEDAAACPSCGKPSENARRPISPKESWLSLSGRITRKVYWLHYMLPITAVGLLGEIISMAARLGSGLSTVITIACLVPQLAASVKRLHDRNHSGWFLLVGMIPLIGWIWFFIEVGCMRGTLGPNRYGEDSLPDIRFPMPAVASGRL